MSKTKYMIVAGASVVAIRDGRRTVISAGGGADFSEDEIASILRGAPGALRTPINEGRGKVVEDGTDSDDGTEIKTETKTTGTPGKKTTKSAKAAEKPASDAADDDDGDI